MDVVRALVETQEHDLSIARLEKDLDELPEKRAILAARAKIADIEKLKVRADAFVHAAEAAAKAVEDSIATLTAKMDAEQAKLVSGVISNPKELQAISLELDSLRRQKEAREADELAQMDKRETGAAQVAKIDAALSEGHKVEAQLTERFREHGGEVLTQLEAAKRERAVLAAAMGADLLARYEASRERHGTALGVLSAGRCSACRVNLPAAKVAALEAGPDVGACPGCGRILIVRGA